MQLAKEKMKITLAKHNFIEDNSANLIVKLSVHTDSGTTQVGSRPVWGETGIQSATTYGAYGSGMYNSRTTYQPSYGVVGSSVYTYTRYDMTLIFELYDIKQDKSVYKAIVSHWDTNPSFAVYSAMFDAVFKKFPQNSGTSKKVTTYIATVM